MTMAAFPSSTRTPPLAKRVRIVSSNLLVSYGDYIKAFTWNGAKFSTKRSLLELTSIIQKKMKDHDDMLKRHQEEQNVIKNKLAGFIKKEGGSLAVRDFTDDIYASRDAVKEWFVESVGSELFSNVCVVVPKLKQATFTEDAHQMMADYFDATDAIEDKRLPDMARMRLAELKDKGSEEWDKFLTAAELADLPEEEVDEKAKEFIAKGMRAEIVEKRKRRVKVVICPGAFKPLGIDDKEGNSVFRLVVIKQYADDVIKACRRKGMSARMFIYDKE